IRDFHVTGVQTCALPISAGAWSLSIPFGVSRSPRVDMIEPAGGRACGMPHNLPLSVDTDQAVVGMLASPGYFRISSPPRNSDRRSEGRRVGTERGWRV